MKPLTKATKKRFRSMLERLPSYRLDRFKNDRLELKTKYREDGVPNTTLNLFSVREGDPNKYTDICRETALFPNDLFEKRFVKDNLYGCPLTDSNVELIFHTWPHNQLVLDHNSRKLCVRILTEGIRQDENAKIVAKYKNSKDIDKDKPYLPEFRGFEAVEPKDSDKQLTCFQKVARHLGVESNYLNLFMEQGTGKTAAAIGMMVNDCLKRKIPFYRAVIICPKNVRFNWERELKTFCPIPHKVTIVRGTKMDREVEVVRGIMPDPEVRISFVISSYGALRSTLDAMTFKEILMGQIKLPEDLKWDCAIGDEIHFVKSPRAKRTEAMFALRDASRKRIGLTGTPIANSLFDLWAQWEWLKKYLSGFSNFTAFKDFHTQYEKGRGGKKQIAGFTHVPLLQERLARTSFLISKKEALPDLPPKTYDTIEVSMTPEQSKIYSKVLNQLYVQIEAEIGSSDLPKEMLINNVLTKLLRLTQVTSGFVSWDEVHSDDGELLVPKIIDRIDPNPKLEELVSLLKDKDPDQKTIIWACFEQDLKTIDARLRLEGMDSVLFYGKTKDYDRQVAEYRFNCDPDCKVFVGNPDAGGVGLNLLGYNYRNDKTEYSDLNRETNCDHIIYYSQGWKLTARSQSEDRANRRGTRVTTRITDLMVPGSIDQEIRERVTQKIETANLIKDVRKVLERISNPLIGDGLGDD